VSSGREQIPAAKITTPRCCDASFGANPVVEGAKMLPLLMSFDRE